MKYLTRLVWGTFGFVLTAIGTSWILSLVAGKTVGEFIALAVICTNLPKMGFTSIFIWGYIVAWVCVLAIATLGAISWIRMYEDYVNKENNRLTIWITRIVTFITTFFVMTLLSSMGNQIEGYEVFAIYMSKLNFIHYNSVELDNIMTTVMLTINLLACFASAHLAENLIMLNKDN